MTLETNNEIKNIGFNSPKDALTKSLQELGYDINEKNLKIKEVCKNGVTMAYALRYVEHWNEWTFLEINDSKSNTTTTGTCIEGIKVDFNTPGFKGLHIYCLADASGESAPKTNVARSNIEITQEREQLLSSVYSIYLDHIADELNNLSKSGFSITWAAKEANWLLTSFIKGNRYRATDYERLEDNKSLKKSLMDLRCILVEKNKSRELTSINNLKQLNHFWTIDCASYTSADSLIKEAKSSNSSALDLLRTIYGSDESNTSHIDCLLCSDQYSDNITDKIINEYFQVDNMKIFQEQRRLDLRWSLTKEKIWEEITYDEDEHGNESAPKCYVQLIDFADENTKFNQIAINSSNALFILNNSELNKYLIKIIGKLSERSNEDNIALSKIVSLLNSIFYYKDLNKSKIEEYIENRFERSKQRDVNNIVWSRIDKQELITTILKTDFVKFDTTIWYRRGHY
jgi:hypothetical protein